MIIEEFQEVMHLIDQVGASDYELRSDSPSYLGDDCFCLYRKKTGEEHYFEDSLEVSGFLRAALLKKGEFKAIASNIPCKDDEKLHAAISETLTHTVGSGVIHTLDFKDTTKPQAM